MGKVLKAAGVFLKKQFFKIVFAIACLHYSIKLIKKEIKEGRYV
jgi:hypothetical protein